MQLLVLLSTTFLLLPTILALPNPDATFIPEVEIDAELFKRACTSLSYSKCHANIGARGGIYCGFCSAVLGTDQAISGHQYYAYQLNAHDGSCCTYGARSSCRTAPRDSQCPI